MSGSANKKYAVRKMTPEELAARAKAEKRAKGTGLAGLVKGWPGLLLAGAGVIAGVTLFPVSTRLAAVTAGFMFVTGLVWFAMGENPWDE